MRHQGKDEAVFTLETIYGNLNENAKTLTLTPYTSTWGIYKKVGNQFTIDLSLLK